MGNEQVVEMFVGGLMLDPNTQAPVVVLKDESGQICLPIWIGVAEATSIASAIKQLPMARPLTHDLLFEMLQELGVSVQRVVITELKESTYYAELVVSYGEKALVFDSRPSDAIGIAVRASVPIYVAKAVLDQAKITTSPVPAKEGSVGGELPQPPEGTEGVERPEHGAGDFTGVSKEKWNEILNNLDPEDFKYKM